MTKCPECGNDLKSEVRTVPYTYKGQTIKLEQPGEWCHACGEGVLTPVNVKATEKALQEFRGKVDSIYGQ